MVAAPHPLLVHDGGWPHLAANAAALVVVGVSVERAFGRRLWLALYLAGGLAGEPPTERSCECPSGCYSLQCVEGEFCELPLYGDASHSFAC